MWPKGQLPHKAMRNTDLGFSFQGLKQSYTASHLGLERRFVQLKQGKFRARSGGTEIPIQSLERVS